MKFTPGILLAVLLCFATQTLKAQKVRELPVYPSASGAVLLLPLDSSLALQGTQLVISRANSDKNFKQIAKVARAATLKDFANIAGTDVLAGLKKAKKISSDRELWKYIQTHAALKNYGFSTFQLGFLQAMGLAYVDKDEKTMVPGTTIYYKAALADNSQSAEGSIITGSKATFGKPKQIMASAGDSSIRIKWGYKKQSGESQPFTATLKRKMDGGAFEPQPVKLLALTVKDSVFFNLIQPVQPGGAYRYFITPGDIFGNVSTINSDTVNLVAANLKGLPPLTNMKARDTTAGIVLTWAPLTTRKFVAGIEIQRSRISTGNYVIMDTVAATGQTYLDTRLTPGVVYYYRLRVLGLTGDKVTRYNFSGFASASHAGKHIKPDAPYNIIAKTTKNGVLVSWQPVNSVNLAGYYVYRTPANDTAKTATLSRLITDTSFTDTTKNASRRTAYIYTVRAVSISNVKSNSSAGASAHLPFGKDAPLTPGSITVLMRGNNLLITWDDVKKNDAATLGYLLYKRKRTGATDKYDITKPASAEATRLNFIPVFKGLLTTPFFTDDIPSDGTAYEYAVSAIDSYGAESGLSAFATNPAIGASVNAPRQIYLRKVSNGIEVRWLQANSPEIKSFEIYRRTINEKNSTQIGTVDKSQRNYVDRSAAHDTLYVYTVVAVSGQSKSAPALAQSIKW